jgi:hypothetical protein
VFPLFVVLPDELEVPDVPVLPVLLPPAGGVVPVLDGGGLSKQLELKFTPLIYKLQTQCEIVPALPTEVVIPPTVPAKQEL